MSLSPTQTLSLLQSMLREQNVPSQGPRTSSAAFANRLDQALERGMVPDSATPESVQRAAEALRLETLRSSLELLGDQQEPSGGMPLSLPKPVNSLAPEMQAYLANLVNGHNESSAPRFAPPQPLPPEDPGPKSVSQLSLLRDTATKVTDLELIIQKASRKYGVDEALIRAVIKAESNFNPRAVSHAGAQGLMQLMPATARGLGVQNSFDPEQNVMAGTKFLKDLLERYKGDLDAALAAYNWGPGNVDRRPDRLPRETRDYLVKVKQLYAGYSA